VVRVTVSSTLVDLSTAAVKLYLNGKLVSSYSGTISVPVTVGGAGEVSTISATVTAGGKTYTKKISVGTGDVSLVVDATSTASPFYEGGLLVAPQGRVRVVALADLRKSAATRIDPATLVYTWKFGNQVLESSSGIGKNVLDATAPVRYRDAQVSVTVMTQDGSRVAEAHTVISPVDPIIRIYPSNPLLGVDFTKALSGTYQLSGTEESFRVEPYFFGAAPDLLWSVNGQGSGTSDTVTVRQTGTGAGRANLSLSARLGSTHQSVTRSIALIFGSQQQTNIFGF